MQLTAESVWDLTQEVTLGCMHLPLEKDMHSVVCALNAWVSE